MPAWQVHVMSDRGGARVFVAQGGGGSEAADGTTKASWGAGPVQARPCSPFQEFPRHRHVRRQARRKRPGRSLAATVVARLHCDRSLGSVQAKDARRHAGETAEAAVEGRKVVEAGFISDGGDRIT